MDDAVVPCARSLNAVRESSERTGKGVLEFSAKMPSLVCKVTYLWELPDRPPRSGGTACEVASRFRVGL